jgi:hypothetical protein
MALYRIDWIGEVAFGVRTEGDRPVAFSLEENQTVPSEIKEGDLVDIVNRPDHPANIAMGVNRGYYEVTHPKSGKTFQVWHKNDLWRLDAEKTG